LSSVITLSDRDVDHHDPYVLCGTFLIQKDDCKFIKFADFLDQEDLEKVMSLIFIDAKSYHLYVEFRTEYQKWARKFGSAVSVVGGEDYTIPQEFKVDDLFFGEHSAIKKDLFDFAIGFFEDEKFYTDNKIPWKSSIFIEGPTGNGKTSLVNTFIRNCEATPITINPDNCDDSVLEILFNIVIPIRQALIIIENIDVLIEEELVSADTLVNFMDKCNSINGTMLLLTSRKSIPDIDKLSPADINKLSFRFDKKIKLPMPTYKESVDNLFGDYFDSKGVSKVRKMIVDTGVNYGYLSTIKELFAMSNIKEIKENKRKGYIKSLTSIINSIKKENNIKQGKTSIKIGLIKGRD